MKSGSVVCAADAGWLSVDTCLMAICLVLASAFYFIDFIQ